MTEFGRYSPSSIAEHSCHLVRYHQATAPHVDREFAGTTLQQDSFTEVLRHLCCEQAQARRVTSCHHLATMEATVNPIRNGGDATVQRIATILLNAMSSRITWFSSKVPITTYNFLFTSVLTTVENGRVTRKAKAASRQHSQIQVAVVQALKLEITVSA